MEERWIFEFFLSLLEGESSLFGNSQQVLKGRLSLIRKIFNPVPYSKVDYSMVVPIYLSRSRCNRQWKPVSHAFCLYQELLWSGGLSPYTNPLSIWLHTACLSSHSCPTDMRIFFTLGTYKTSERTIVPAHAFWITTFPRELTMESCHPYTKKSYLSMEQIKQRHWDPLLFGYLLLYHSTFS